MARGRKPKFNKKLILFIIANYFYDHRNENLSVYSLETVYADIIAKASESLRYKNVAFPGYEHIRKILIDTLSKNKLFQKGERMTTTAASRIVQLYNHFSDADEIEIIISEQYTISIYDNPVITCKVELPLKRSIGCSCRKYVEYKKESYILEQIQYDFSLIQVHQTKKCRCDPGYHSTIQQIVLHRQQRKNQQESENYRFRI